MLYALLLIVAAGLAAFAPGALFVLLALVFISWAVLIELRQIAADLDWLAVDIG